MKYTIFAVLAFLPMVALAQSNFQVVSGNSNVSINGKTYHGNSVSVNGNGNVIVDGVQQSEKPLVGPISVVVDGNAQSVTTASGKIEVKGTAGQVKTMSGDVRIGGDVLGAVSTMSGDVTAKIVKGGAQSMSGEIDTDEQ